MQYMLSERGGKSGKRDLMMQNHKRIKERKNEQKGNAERKEGVKQKKKKTREGRKRAKKKQLGKQ